MSIHTGITTGTPTRIPFGAGVYFQGVDFDPKVAPTEEEIRAGIIGATQEGGTLKITPEFFNPELDGATVALMELDNKVGETAEMEVSFAEVTADILSKQMIGTVSETVSAIRAAQRVGYKTITSHRSGECEDSIIADIAVGMRTPLVKMGAPARAERTAKYNRLMKIEDELSSPVYMGRILF